MPMMTHEDDLGRSLEVLGLVTLKIAALGAVVATLVWLAV